MAARRRSRGSAHGLEPRGPRGLRLVLATALAAALTILGVPQLPAQAAAGITITGSGFGHGIGMSQYGAQGHATAGHSYTTILAAYYPGTTLATGSDATALRVRITGDNDNVTTVRAESGMSLHAGSRSLTLPTTVSGTAPTLWRIRLVSGALRVEAYAGGSWRAGGSAVDAVVNGSATAELRTSDGTLQLQLGSTYREYRGQVRAHKVNSTTLQTIAVVKLSDYLPSVIASEMPSSWHPQALAAQAVAARSYALRDRHDKPSSAAFDTCDSTACQVFNGLADYNASGTRTRSWTAASTVTATNNTAGRYLTYQGIPAFTQFSASNGGYRAAGSQPYLKAAPDSYDGYAQWTVTLTGADISARYPTIGSLRSVTTVRDGKGPYGGRITSATLTGSNGSVTVTGAQLRSAFALRSTLAAITVNAGSAERDLTGDGWPDVVGTHVNGTLYRWSGRPDGSLQSRVKVGSGWNRIGASALVTGFGAPGVSELFAVETATGRLLAFPANGKGGFGSARVVGTSSWQTMDLIVGVTGFDGPSSVGFVARHASSGRLYYYPANGRGGHGARVQIGTGWNSMSVIAGVGDYDENGTPDIVSIDGSGRLFLYPGTGSGALGKRRQIGYGWGTMVALVGGADADGDGHLDLIAQRSDGLLFLYLGNGTGAHGPRHQIGYGWTNFRVIC